MRRLMRLARIVGGFGKRPGGLDQGMEGGGESRNISESLDWERDRLLYRG